MSRRVFEQHFGKGLVFGMLATVTGVLAWVLASRNSAIGAFFFFVIAAALSAFASAGYFVLAMKERRKP